MPYTEADVGKRMVDGVEVAYTLAEREVKSDDWTTEASANALKRAASEQRRGRLTALRALIKNRSASQDNVLEYLDLKEP